MLEWAATNNGVVRKGRKASLIQWTLANIEELSRIQTMLWSSRNWAMTAMRDIERIGVSDGFQLLPPPINGVTTPVYRIRQICSVIGLHCNKINGRLVITKQPLTLATTSVMVADLPVERRGETSP